MTEHMRDGRPVPGWINTLNQRIEERDQPRPTPGQPVSEMVTINPNAAAQLAAERQAERERQAQDARDQSPDGWLGRTVAGSDARTRQYREERQARIERHEAAQRAAAVERYGITGADLEPADAA